MKTKLSKLVKETYQVLSLLTFFEETLGKTKTGEMSNTVQIKELPKFSGNKEDFLEYAILFKAVANLKTFDDALGGTHRPRSGDLTQAQLMAGEDWNEIKEYYRQK